MREHDAIINSYEHLAQMPRSADALFTLRKIASLVKPIMRKRGWKVGTLQEFYPSQQNLLGLNIDRGRQICLRLRYPGDANQFLQLEQVTDTMLHELSHIVHGPHDAKFQALWDELRDEYQTLVMKGYSGEGFLTPGHMLGGQKIPMHEMRRQARAAAERRKTLQHGSGQRLGGTLVLRGTDMRSVIADAADRRNKVTKGCASGTDEAVKIADEASKNGFRTKAEENEANERAISQALWELVQEDEARKAGVEHQRDSTDVGLIWDPESGLRRPEPGLFASTQCNRPLTPPPVPTHSRPKSTSSSARPIDSTPLPNPQSEATNWPCPLCTLVNQGRHLCCDACGSQRPYTKNLPHDSDFKVPARTLGPSNTDLPTPKRAALPSSSQQQQIERRQSLPMAKSATQAATSKQLGWNCRNCGSFMESQWWTCSLCGLMKQSS